MCRDCREFEGPTVDRQLSVATTALVVTALLYGAALSDSMFMLEDPNQVFPHTFNPYSAIVSHPCSALVNIYYEFCVLMAA